MNRQIDYEEIEDEISTRENASRSSSRSPSARRVRSAEKVKSAKVHFSGGAAETPKLPRSAPARLVTSWDSNYSNKDNKNLQSKRKPVQNRSKMELLSLDPDSILSDYRDFIYIKSVRDLETKSPDSNIAEKNQKENLDRSNSNLLFRSKLVKSPHISMKLKRETRRRSSSESSSDNRDTYQIGKLTFLPKSDELFQSFEKLPFDQFEWEQKCAHLFNAIQMRPSYKSNQRFARVTVFIIILLCIVICSIIFIVY